MATPETTLANAINAKFKTQIVDGYNTAYLSGRVAYENAPFDAPADGMWVRPKILTGETNQVAMGSPKTFRIVGVFMIQIFIQVYSGDGLAVELADFIKDNFESMSVSGLTWYANTLKRIGRTKNADSDKWFQLNLECPFHYDYTRNA